MTAHAVRVVQIDCRSDGRRVDLARRGVRRRLVRRCVRRACHVIHVTGNHDDRTRCDADDRPGMSGWLTVE